MLAGSQWSIIYWLILCNWLAWDVPYFHHSFASQSNRPHHLEVFFFFFLGQILFHKGPISISKCHIKPYNVLLLLPCFEFSVVKSKQNSLKISYILLVCATIQHQTHQTNSDTFTFQQGLFTLLKEMSSELRMGKAAWRQSGQAKLLVGLIRREYK